MAAKITTSGKIFFGILALLAVILLASSYLAPNPTTTISTTTETSITQTSTSGAVQTSQNHGRIVIGFTNSVSKVARIGTATFLNVTIKQIYISENNQDWISVFNSSKTFNAISFANQTAVIADTNVPIKTYSQEKIVLGSGQIKIYSLLYNNFGNIAYTLLPGSNETIISYPFTPSQNETTFLVFDLNGSITHTADGYVLSQQFTPSVSTFANGQQPSNSILIS